MRGGWRCHRACRGVDCGGTRIPAPEKPLSLGRGRPVLRVDQGLAPWTCGMMPKKREAKVGKGENGDLVAPELSVRAGPRWGATMHAQFLGSDAGTLPGPTAQRAGVSAEGGLIYLFICTWVRVVGLKAQEDECFHWRLW